MTKRGKKRSRTSSNQCENNTTTTRTTTTTARGWTKVDVGLGENKATSIIDFNNNDNHDDDDDDAIQTLFKENHYDNPRLASKATLDLEANPMEHYGVFLGLEVLDGSEYTVVVDKDTGAKKLFQSTNINAIDKANESNNESSVKVEREEKLQGSTSGKEEKIVTTSKTEENGTKKKKKQKKKKKGQIKDNDSTDASKSKDNETATTTGRKDGSIGPVVANTDSSTSVSDEEIAIVQSQWMPATGGVLFHNTLYQSLVENKWLTPAPIQAAVLPAAILGRRNIVGAAPTGSGKTLAFLLPIYQHLLEQRDQLLLEYDDDADDADQAKDEKDKYNVVKDNYTAATASVPRRMEKVPLQALILTPTRELALQIHAEGEKLWKGQIGTLVGGLAVAKQQRVLDKNRPPIITATPGRLWELLSSGQHEHLNDLSQLRYLVIDEADRMIQQGSFPQLELILDAVQKSNPMYDSDDEDNESDVDDAEEDDLDERMQGLPGIPGEARVTMLNDSILKQIKSERNGGRELNVDDHDEEEETEQLDEAQHDNEDIVIKNEFDSNYDSFVDDATVQDTENSDDESIALALPSRPPVHRQTFIYSATLMLPASASFKSKKRKNPKRSNKQSVDGAIAEILEKAHAKGITKIVDLTNTSSTKKSSVISVGSSTDKTNSQSGDKKNSKAVSNSSVSSVRLPEGLVFHVIKCTQRHKDSFLYSYLMTTTAGKAGHSIIFCNSIAAVRRVGATLQVLGLPIRILHAHMQQRARLKAVESLNQASKSRVVVVATDVAARGLDIPFVAAIIHYDAARSMDTFIHRSGRTARGIGEGAVGTSLSLVAPDEDRFHSAMVDKLNVNFENINIDGRLLSSAQERVNLASKIFTVDEKQTKTKRQNQWFEETAAQADITLDENCLDDGIDVDLRRHTSELRECENAKIRLQQLLAQPMQTQKFGKFLSTNSAAFNDVSDQLVVRQPTKNQKKRRRR